jgi:exonuclease SbcC
MKPLQLNFQAFGPYAGKVSLDFSDLADNRLFVITGPTGSGKTTIFEAMLYALYGDVSKQGMKPEEVRCDFLPEGDGRITYVEYIFEVGGKAYRIYRQPAQELPKARGKGTHRVEQKAELACLGHTQFQPLTRSGEINDKIRSLIGLDIGQFKKIVMLPQGAFQDFLTSNTKDKMALLRDIFNTGMYASVLEKLKQEARSLHNEISLKQTRAEAEIGQLQFDEPLPEGVLSASWLDAVRGLADQQAGRIDLLKKEEEAADQKLKQAQAVLDSQKAVNEKLDQLDELNKDVQVQEGRLPQIEENEERVRAARRAQPLTVHQDQIEEESVKLEEAKALLDSTRKKCAAIESQLQSDTQALDQARKESLLWQERDKRLPQMETYARLLGQADGLETACKKAERDVQTAKAEADRCQKNLEGARETAHALELLLQKQERDQASKAALEAERAMIGVHYKAVEDYMSKAGDLQQKEKEVAALTKQEADREQDYKAARAAETAHLAAHLAAGLEEGAPCPVCGAVHHPRLADLSSQMQADPDVNAALAHWQAAQSQANMARADARSLRGQLKEKAQTICQNEGHAVAPEKMQDLLKDLLDQGLEKRHALDALKQEIKKTEDTRQALEKTKRDPVKTEQAWQEASQKQDQAQKALEDSRVALASLRQQVLRLQEADPDLVQESDAQVLASRLNQWRAAIENAAKVLKQAEDSHSQTSQALAAERRAIQEQERRMSRDAATLQKHRLDFAGLVQEAFGSAQAYHAACKDIPQAEALQKECQDLRAALQETRSKRDLLQAAVSGMERADLAPLQDQCQALDLKLSQIRTDAITCMARHDQNMSQIAKLEDLCSAIKEVSDRYAVTGDLAGLVGGDNARKLSFETFVQSYYFEHMLYCANTRFAAMTDGRYSFMRKTDAADLRRQAGLDICVMDQYTGKARDVSTLSGGESFKASLSLALGLSDVVTEESGGIELSTIFIDEGFGTLDEESLEATVETLINLQVSGRLVGVISHVEELKDRIPAQLVVQATRTGSTAHFEVRA